MKYILFLFLLIGITCGYSAELPKFESSEKIYLQPEQISISENGIFVNIANAWFAIAAICHDAKGIYVDEARVGIEYFTWECRYCHFVNPWYVNACQKCGKR